VAKRASILLQELVRLKQDFASPARKAELMGQLQARRLPSADEVEKLHEALCFARAYPEDATVRDLARRMLANFEERSDLRRFRKALEDTGIAGTVLTFRFFWLMAERLVPRWRESLTVDWKEFENREKLAGLLHLLLPFCETPGLDSFGFAAREWVERLKGEDETDAEFLLRRFAALDASTPVREKLYEDLDIPLRLAPGPATPARGREIWDAAPVVYRTKPQRGRPNLKSAIRNAKNAVRPVPPRDARRLIDLANTCMVSRHRDLLIFLHGDPNDVRMIDCGGGLSFACIGARPERRLMLESVYGFLTLLNGVPIGYVLCSALFGTSEVAYNVFETFRGGEAAQVYAKVLGMIQRLFGVDTFAVDPYQLGRDNAEGQQSGAWWFYYKLGFRPHDPGVKALVRDQLAKMKADPSYRTPPRGIHDLAAEYMFLHLIKPRRDVLGHVELGNIGLHISRYLADRFGGAREEGIRTCARETKKMLGVSGSLSPGETIAWQRWSPLVLAIDGIDRWTKPQKTALAKVIRAKGGRRESDFVPLLESHKKLRRALLDLAANEP